MLDGAQEIELDLLASCPTCRGTDDGIQFGNPNRQPASPVQGRSTASLSR